MRFDHYSFPHPILGREDDVIGVADADLEISNDGPENSYEISVVNILENPDIERLIAEDKAVFLTEISCSSTLFRQAITSKDFRQLFHIKKSALRGKVEFLFLVVTTQSLPSYLNSSSHLEFAGLQSDLDEGDVLAYLGRAPFVADIEFRKMKASSSFMEIGEAQKESGEFEIELDHPKIQIKLAKADYRKYMNPEIGGSPKFGSLFQSAVAFPALVHALQQISPSSDKEEYIEKPWARVLQSRIESEIASQGTIFDDESIVKIAQSLLGLPLERLLRDTELSIGGSSEEDDN